MTNPALEVEETRNRLHVRLLNHDDFFVAKDAMVDLDPRPRLANVGDETMMILPPSLRYVNSSRTLAIFERPPTLQTISYVPHRRDHILEGLGEEERRWFQIPLPWLTYVITTSVHPRLAPLRFVNGVWVYAHNTQLTDLHSPVGVLPLPNLYLSGNLCLGAQITGLHVGEIFEKVHNQLWSGGFNDDLAETIGEFNRSGHPQALRRALLAAQGPIPYMSPQEIFAEWEKHSIETVLTWDWYNLEPLAQKLGTFAPAPAVEDQGVITGVNLVANLYAQCYRMDPNR